MKTIEELNWCSPVHVNYPISTYKATFPRYSAEVPYNAPEMPYRALYVSLDYPGLGNPYFFRMLSVINTFDAALVDVLKKNFFEDTFKDAEEIVLRYVNAYLIRLEKYYEKIKIS